MVLKEATVWLNFGTIYNTMGLKGNGLERSCLCTKLSITLLIMGGFGCNFDTMWASIRVTSSCELQLPATLIMEVIEDCVCF